MSNSVVSVVSQTLFDFELIIENYEQPQYFVSHNTIQNLEYQSIKIITYNTKILYNPEPFLYKY